MGFLSTPADSQQRQPHASAAEMRPARHEDTSQLAETQRVNGQLCMQRLGYRISD